MYLEHCVDLVIISVPGKVHGTMCLVICTLVILIGTVLCTKDCSLPHTLSVLQGGTVDSDKRLS